MKVAVNKQIGPPPGNAGFVTLRPFEPLKGFDWDEIPSYWAYQMVPVGDVRYVLVSDWYGDSIEVDNPQIVRVTEEWNVARLATLGRGERLFILQGLACGSATIRMSNPWMPPSELVVRVKSPQEVEAVFHFVTDGDGTRTTTFSPSLLAQWLTEINTLLEPQANFRFQSVGIRYPQIATKDTLGDVVAVSNFADDEGYRLAKFCERNVVNVFFVWTLLSHDSKGIAPVHGVVPPGTIWWQRPAFVGTRMPGAPMSRLIAHEMCHVLWAPDFEEDSSRLMNTYYAGERVDHLTNDRINRNF